MRLRPISVLLLAVLLAAASPANKLNAQTTTSGGLTGVITDQSNAVVPNADVEIKDSAKGTTQSTKTDREGVYRFFFLAPGRYALTVSHVGFREEKRAVNVLLGPPGTVNVTLEIAKASTTLTVTEDAPLIQAENGDVSATMNQEQISEVPNPGNDLTYIVQTAPGVVMNTDTQGLGFNFSILGMPGTSYLYTVDGMNNNDNGLNASQSGALGLALGQNEIQEATVVSTGYSGQFGGAAGGNIEYITKSGGNGFHGNAQYFWNGRVFNANDWFNNALGNPRPFDIANQWAGSLGGPIKKDKLFFFFDSEGVRLAIPQLFFVVIPSPQFEAATIANIDSDPRFGPTSATDAFYKRIFSLYNAAPGTSSARPGGFSPTTDPTGCTGFTALRPGVPCAMNFLSTRSRPSSDTLTSGRVDWNVNKNDRAFLRIQHDRGLGAFDADPISSLFDGDFDVSRWQAQLIETHTFGSSAASQFLLAGSYFVPIFQSRNPSQALSAFPTVLSFNAPGTFTTLGGANWLGAYGRYNTQYQLSEDVVVTRHNQKFGFGANFAPIHWSVLPNKVNAVGQLNPQTLKAFYDGGVDPGVLTGADPNPDFTQLTQSFTSQTTVPISFFNFGLYGQDEWRARPNLTLTLALRAEHYSNPACETRCYARFTGPFEAVRHDPEQPYNRAILINQEHALGGMDSILWSPRFGFAWQPFGVSHNSVLRGGVGLFYDPLPGGVLESFYINAPIYNIYTPSGDSLTPNEKTSLFKDAAASNAAFVTGFAAGQNLAQIHAIDPTFSPPAVNASERKLHSPQFQKLSFEWQQAFGADTSVSIGYFGHHGIHELWTNLSANAFGFGSFPAGLCTSPPVPPCADPRFSQVAEYSTNAVSNYNGMVISFKHQFAGWTQGVFQANYTYGHAFDEVSNGGIFSFTSAGLVNPQDTNNLRGAYGPAEYDVRHSFNASYVLELPVKAALRGHGSDYVVKGWQISGTIFARTGFPYSVVDPFESSNLQQNNYFGEIYSVPVGPLPAESSCGRGATFTLNAHPCQPPQFFVLANGTTEPNPNAAFVQAGCETGFNAGHLGASGVCDGRAVSFSQGRNRFRGPGYFNTDLAIMKNTKITGWENATLGIGFQFFNLFNHPNLGFPDNWSSDAGFGQIFYLEQSPTSILGSGLGGDVAPRMIQLKAQLRF
jgi:hypothetical protein